MQFTILIIDDEKNIREGLAEALELDGYKTKTAATGKEGLGLVGLGDIDLVITDLRMDGISGEEVLKRIVTETPGIPVIVLTGHGSIDSAVDAMRNGAYDFLTKPLNLDRLSLIVKRALQGRELAIRHHQLEDELAGKRAFESIIGKSAEMQRIFEMVRRAADTKASVLITGESGVGKELIANALHNLSSRRDKPFIKVHCAALSETLLESELFGHEKGAFTGASALRVLQDKKFERVGGEETLEVDVRIIAATNRDLLQEIQEKRFREDLYYRLNVVHIHVPPLRERKEDLPLLIAAFLAEFVKENGKQIKGIDSRARAALYKYNWPGNIRQLRNCIESAVVMCASSEITCDDLPPGIIGDGEANTVSVPLGITMAEAEKILIQANLFANRGNKSKTADILGIGRKTLHRKIEEYSITDDKNPEIASQETIAE